MRTRPKPLKSNNRIYGWLASNEEFRDQYARAKECQAQVLFDEIIEIADTPKTGSVVKILPNGRRERRIGDMAEHRRLQIDARKWALSKLLPRKYGDRLEVAWEDLNLNTAGSHQIRCQGEERRIRQRSAFPYQTIVQREATRPSFDSCKWRREAALCQGVALVQSRNNRFRFSNHLGLGCSSIVVGILVAVSGMPMAAQTQSPAADSLTRLNSSVEALIQKVSPCVVQIVATGYGMLNNGARGDTDVVIGRQRAIGSGVIIDPSGYIITNAHVVKGAERIQVLLPPVFGDGTPGSSLDTRAEEVTGRLVGFTSDIDLAVIKIDGHDMPFLPLADYSKVKQGEIVFAFGSPEGLRNSVTMGVVSATARQTDPDSPMVFIQTDAPINPGNSGGPLVNVEGQVVGVNTFIVSQSGGNEGLGFAIPSSIVDISFQQIRKNGHVDRPQIGISAQTISPELARGLRLPRNTGVIISDVVPGSPAENAGLRVQDIILSVDQQQVRDLPFFAFHLLTHRTGDRVHIEVLRGSDRLAFDVPLIEPPHQIDQIASATDPEKSLIRPLGLLAVEITDKIAEQIPGLRDPYGIMIVARSAEGSAEVPLTTGDVIRAVNGIPVRTLDGFRNALQAMAPDSPLVLQIQREQQLQYVTLALDPT